MEAQGQGKIIKILDTMVISDKFSKREVVIRVPDQNPQYSDELIFELIQDKCTYLDNFKVGDDVMFKFNIKGKIHKDKWYNSLRIWNISKVGGNQPKVISPSSEFDGFDEPY
jgi:hypothetical protein